MCPRCAPATVRIATTCGTKVRMSVVVILTNKESVPRPRDQRQLVNDPCAGDYGLNPRRWQSWPKPLLRRPDPIPGPLGKLLDPSVLTRNFEKLARAAGCPGMRLHDLRLGHAAGLMKAGVYPKTIQERLGHASPGFTLAVYGHVAAGAQAEAANAFAKLMSEEVG